MTWKKWKAFQYLSKMFIELQWKIKTNCWTDSLYNNIGMHEHNYVGIWVKSNRVFSSSQGAHKRHREWEKLKVEQSKSFRCAFSCCPCTLVSLSIAEKEMPNCVTLKAESSTLVTVSDTLELTHFLEVKERNKIIQQLYFVRGKSQVLKLFFSVLLLESNDYVSLNEMWSCKKPLHGSTFHNHSVMLHTMREHVMQISREDLFQRSIERLTNRVN